MFKFIFPTIFIGVSIVGVLTFTNPIYKEVMKNREKSSSYDTALGNSKAFEAVRDRLTQKFNSLRPESLARLSKLLPDNIDNIRLILEIEEKIAAPYGMVLKDVKYSTLPEGSTDNSDNLARSGASIENLNKNYGIWDLEFSAQGTYSNFVKFLRDLERNLRIIDVSAVDFSSTSNIGAGGTPSETYTYSFKIRTYWLKK